MRMKNLIFSSLLFFSSSICALLLLEFGWSVWSEQFPDGSVDYSKRVMFFAGLLPVYENNNDIFTYTPNNTVRAKTIYFSATSFEVEYDYTFKTNNFGLVMDKDVLPERPSLLLLGDSFTEGQGAEPWFRAIAPEIDRFGLQAINGGLMATGFEQFWKLEKYLTGSGIQVSKLVVIFISDDFRRAVKNFSPRRLGCLSSLQLCDGTESFYALPRDADMPGFIDKIRRLRASRMGRLQTRAPATFRLYQLIRDLLVEKPPNPESISRARASERVVREMLKKYGAQNVVFVHLPEKWELDRQPEKFGLLARDAIARAGGNLYDGFKNCQLSLADYHVHDGHPNQSGYAKIASCVSNALSRIGFVSSPDLLPVNSTTSG